MSLILESAMLHSSVRGVQRIVLDNYMDAQQTVTLSAGHSYDPRVERYLHYRHGIIKKCTYTGDYFLVALPNTVVYVNKQRMHALECLKLHTGDVIQLAGASHLPNKQPNPYVYRFFREAAPECPCCQSSAFQPVVTTTRTCIHEQLGSA